MDVKGRTPSDELGPLENETGLLLDSIQDSLQLHRVDVVRCGNRHVDTMRFILPSRLLNAAFSIGS